MSGGSGRVKEVKYYRDYLSVIVMRPAVSTSGPTSV